MSSEKEFTGIWRIISIPPRIFDWVLDHKLLTLLAVGAVYWGCGEIKGAYRRYLYEQQKIEEQKKAEKEAAIQAERWEKQQVEIKKSKALTFRNMATPDPQTPTHEELERKAREAKEERLLTEKAVRNAVKYAFPSQPKLKPMPVPMNQRDNGAKR